jgi:hypothetical protein
MIICQSAALGFGSHRKYFPFLALLHSTDIEVTLINGSHMKDSGADAEWTFLELSLAAA